MRHLRDLQTLVHVALAAALYAAALGYSVWFAPLAILVGIHTLAIEHNHAHAPVFRWRPVNVMLDDLLTLLCGVPEVFWHVHHMRSHHRHTWTEHDWSSPFNYRGASAPWKPVGYRYYQLTYYPLFAADSVDYILRRRDPRFLGARLRSVFVLAAGSASLIGLVGIGRWLLVMAPAYVGTGMMLGAANYLEHWNCHRAGEFKAWTFTCSVHNVLTYNSGYHWLHHQRPGLHWSELPGIHRRDPSYCDPDLIESGLFPGYRSGASFRRWLEGTARAEPLVSAEARTST